MDPSTGAIRVPTYTQFSRAEHCPLLKHSWAQNWEEVIKVCASQPWRSLHMTKYSGRTALHLATFDRRCPLSVARALLKANRHMIAVRDSNNYTPLHIVAFFSAATTLAQIEDIDTYSNETENPAGNALAINHIGRTTEQIGGNAGNTQRIAKVPSTANNTFDAEAEAMSVMSLFCDTAIMVEQELRRGLGENQEAEELPLLEGTSPLYLAAKKGAPVSILRILLETRSRTNWIAPSTGGEPYWYEPKINARVEFPFSPSFSSPLEILLREDRLRSSMNASYYRNDVFLLGEEEDGNLLRRGRSQNNENGRNRIGGAASGICKDRSRVRRSPLHPDEIRGVPHLINEMRRIAIDRCDEHYSYHEERNEERKSSELDPSIDTPIMFTQSQQRCLELWEKCIELLVEAGGGGIPLLLEENNLVEKRASKDSNNKSFDRYGILHACVCCKVPVPSLVEIALILFPDQVSKRDAVSGLIPLHHVLCAKHKYSYATSNLLNLLLKSRSNTKVSPSSKSTIKNKKNHRHHRQRQSSTNSARRIERMSGSIPELPSLVSFENNLNDEGDRISWQKLNPQCLKSTVLLPFPNITYESTKLHREKPMHKFTGPIPLIFAIRLGLPMEGVIDKLLEADLHDSLRTIDPLSRLPPFALVATRVSPSDQCNVSSDLDLSSDSENEQRPKETSSDRSNNYNDIITAAIGSTINILSSGDGNHMSQAHITMTMSDTNTSINNTFKKRKKEEGTWPMYKLDDVYRLLLAHPQVLSQYVVD